MSDDSSDSNDSSSAKVTAIFRELVGERVARLDSASYNHDSAAAIATALASPSEDQTAKDIAFNLTDWASDAAFIVAIQLFPERFTALEIADGVEAFLRHAPSHIVTAAVLSGQHPEDIFGVAQTNL